MNAQRLPKSNRLLLRILVPLGRILFRIYFRLRCEGCDNAAAFAREGKAFIMVMNHASNLDAAVIGVCGGVAFIANLSFPGKKELFDNRLTGWLMRALGGIRLDRETLDLSTARTIMLILRSGRGVGVAPEGTRSATGEVMPFKSGFVKLALRFGVPVLPVGVQGTHLALPKHTVLPRPKKVIVRFGKPIELSRVVTEDGNEMTEDELAELVRQEVIRLSGGTNRP
jgi:1-acyl-sn-glycerol-3-phosphate acyltransferase